MMDFVFTPAEKQTLLKLARTTIAAAFKSGTAFEFTPTACLTRPCGAFVTLHKKTGSLRGCIGFITAARPLVETVKEAALASAFHDSRFPPLEEKELPQVFIEISVLSPFKKIENLEEIRVGSHGLLIRSGHRSGLLLPQVATEQGWDRNTFLTHTCYKAGLPGDSWKNPGTEVEIFQAMIFNEQEFAI